MYRAALCHVETFSYLRRREEVLLQTSSDIVVNPLHRHCGICNGIPLLVLHNAPDATMHLHREDKTF